MKNILVSRSVECALDTARCRIVLRDIGKLITYQSPDPAREIVRFSSADRFSVNPGWQGLPEWVSTVSLAHTDGHLHLSIETHPETPREAMEGLADEMVSELTELFAHPVRPFGKKVFCLGWEKTGTTSITAAMRRLGIFSWHSCPWLVGITHARGEIPNDTRPDFSLLTEYDFLSDMPICLLHKELDKAYPDSLFILTTRPVDAWLPSALTEIEKGTELSGMTSSIVRWAYGTADIDALTLRDRYLRHAAEVMEYFAGRRNFLSINLADGNPWLSLCGFLGLPVPDTPFPWLNKRVE